MATRITKTKNTAAPRNTFIQCLLSLDLVCISRAAIALSSEVLLANSFEFRIVFDLERRIARLHSALQPRRRLIVVVRCHSDARCLIHVGRVLRLEIESDLQVLLRFVEVA